MQFRNLDIGYDPRRSPSHAVFCGGQTLLATVSMSFVALILLAPIHPYGEALDPHATWNAVGGIAANEEIQARLLLSVAIGVVAGFVAFFLAEANTPLTEPFLRDSDGDPRVYYGEDACYDLRRRLTAESGPDAKSTGFYLAPHLPMPRAAETKNILIVGAPKSGKSNISRALADQAIERGDRVLLLCNKGDVTSAFASDEAVLIAPHHRDSFALDLSVDISDVASATQFAADIVPASNPPFWSDCARVVLTDLILNLQMTKPLQWSARTLLSASLSDSQIIRDAIGKIDLNGSPLLQSADPDVDDRTVTGILMTLRSAAFVNLRPLAWAWDKALPNRRFAVKSWLSKKYEGPRTLIVQYSPEYEALSTLVIGGLVRRIARRLSDPQLAIDPKRRVVMILDEFHLLQKIDGLAAALAVGREKGLVCIFGVQNFGQLIKNYDREGAEVLADLFQIKIYGRHTPGDFADLAAKRLGERAVSALVANRTPGEGDKRKWVEERKTIPTFNVTRLASELGIVANATETGDVRAVVQCYGQCYVIEWPFTLWRKKRAGFFPAPWLTNPPRI
jgi:hypothetical protein